MIRKMVVCFVLIGTLLPTPVLATGSNADATANEVDWALAEQVGTEILAAKTTEQQVQIYRSLSPEEREAADAFFTVGKVHTEVTSAEPSGQVNPQATNCWSYWVSRGRDNPLGYPLWEFKVNVEWSGDGSFIRNYAYDWITVSTPGAFWDYEGVIEEWTLGGVNYNQYETYNQGKFTYCPIDIGCLKTDTPWIDIWVSAWGSTSFDRG